MGPFWRQRSEFLQRSPAEEQPLLTDVGEPHRRLRLLALSLDVDDHALTPFGVTHVIADPQPEHLGAVLHRPLRPEGPLDDLVPVAAHRGAPSARAVRLPLARA